MLSGGGVGFVRALVEISKKSIDIFIDLFYNIR